MGILLLIAAFATACITMIKTGPEQISTEVSEDAKSKIVEKYGKLPLSFIRNDGQVDEEVKFYERGSGHNTYFTREGVCLELISAQEDDNTPPREEDGVPSIPEVQEIRSETIKLALFGANKYPEIISKGLQEGKVNFFIGNNPEKWKTNVPTYRSVLYKEMYKDIDVKYYGNNRQLEYDIIVKPGADPSQVKFSCEGIEGLRVTDKGDMEIILKEGKLTQKKLYIYQEIDGKRKEIEGEFKIINSELPTTGFVYGFQVAQYDAEKPLIIDPVLSYSTYLGGGGNNYGRGIAVDSGGNAYVTGHTRSGNFPLVSPIQVVPGGDSDVFVTKIDASGSSISYSTYLGGSSLDAGYDIAVDSVGNAYVTGVTASDNFPLASPIQGRYRGWPYYDAFVTKIDASGSVLSYSTYLGGSKYEHGNSIAVDDLGNAYVTGDTDSHNFPTSSPIQESFAGGSFDAFVTKINASGTALSYSTYLGGKHTDNGHGIAVDSEGNAYVTGETSSTNFPLASPIQGSFKWGSHDAFVTKIDASGSTLSYSTYLGGSSNDKGYGIAVDSEGNAYVTGETSSANFPLVSPIQGSHPVLEGGDVFITKINASGNALSYSSSLGGSFSDFGYGIAVDSEGSAYVTGTTYSSDFPLASPIQHSGSYYSAFVAKINASGSALSYSTYLAGSDNDFGRGIAVDSRGNAYVTGDTQSKDFPLASPIQGSLAGPRNAFVTKIVSNDNQKPVADAGQSQAVEQDSAGGTQVTLDGSGSNDPEGDTLTYVWIGTFGSATGVGPTVTIQQGVSNVNLVVNDGQLDSLPDTVIITVQDTTAPVVTAPADVTAEATGPQTSVATGTATATDAVGVVSLTSNAPADYPVGTTTVTWTATDAAGNTGTDTQTITITDTTAPVVTAPADVTAEATGPQTSATIGTATATDVVGVVSLTSNAPADYPVGTTTVTWTATDAAGNTGTATQTVTITDNIAPVVTAPTDIKVQASGPISVSIGAATATDAVGVESITSDAPAAFPVGVTIVTWTATDASGNAGTATQTITILLPEEAVEELISVIVDEMNLPAGTENSLISKLESAIKSFEKGKDKTATNQLNAFINQVRALRGKEISEEDAEKLIEYATNIIDSL